MLLIRQTLRLLTLSVLLVAVFGVDVHAYIDPGTGSYVFQLLIAGVLGAAFAAKVFWRRIAAFITSHVRRSGSSDGDDGEKSS